MKEPPQIFALGDHALTISFGNEISRDLNDRVLELASHFQRNRFSGFVELVPAYSSLTLFYEVPAVLSAFPLFETAFEAVRSLAVSAHQNLSKLEDTVPRIIEIPVSFDPDNAPDIDFVSAECNLSSEEVINIFTARTYRVYMMGFLPGFAYMGEVDERIAVPRRSSPRETVPEGSVAIAGRQTGIYPMISPGGWQIIGRTDVKLFTPESEQPTYLKSGDLVAFRNY